MGLAAAVLVVGCLLAAPARASTLPSGFRETTALSGLTEPTIVRFASDGRVFVAEKSGLIKVFQSLSDTNPTVFADLRTEVQDFWDRGLLGLALDPGFPTQPYVYALYTHDAAIGGTAPRWGDTCPTPPGATGDGCVVSGRLARFTATGNVASAKTVLIEDWCQQYPSHTVGNLMFGPDGALYVSGGDGASFTFTDYGQKGSPLNPCGDPPTGVGGIQIPPTAEGGALRSQDLRTSADSTTLDGAILRVDPATGAGLPDNPLASSTNANARRIIAEGLRNPFRFTFRPGTNEVWLGDVGYNTWEEIDRITSPTASVKNFGWPCYEGAGQQANYSSAGLSICSNLYAQSGAVTGPYYTYNHSAQVVSGETCATGSSSTTGTAFYTATTYPASYKGALFFADYSRKCIWAMLPGTNGLPDPASRVTFAAGAADPVDLEVGPGGDLFYVDLNGGTVRRIDYPAGNRTPTAVIKATPTSGPPPLSVAFDGTSSADPDADPLAYSWDLDGDGAFGDSTAAKPSYTYTSAGSYSARLRVTDPLGHSSTATTTIAVGNPPTATISSPSSSLTWKVGDTISFSGSATDPQDGAVPASRLSWSVILHHCSPSNPSSCHTHLIQTFSGVSGGSFSAPDHDYPSYLELQLTATDSAGLKDVKSIRVDPKTVNLTFDTRPSGLQLAAGSSTGATPFTRTVIVGSTNSISAPSPQSLSGTSYMFSSWSDGGAQSHDIVAPASPATYTANFATGAGSLLVGTQAVQPATDYNSAGTAEAFRMSASGSGTLSSVSVYVDPTSTANKLTAGVYADNGGHPGALLTQGTISSPTAGAWNLVPVPSATVSAGGAYWISVLGPAGSTGLLRFRDKLASGGQAETSAGASLSSLPQAWVTGTTYGDGPISAYASAAGSTAPILAVSPSSLSFSATQGAANPAPGSFNVANNGAGTLSFSVTDDASWLTESPTSGTAPGSVQVSASTAGLAAGTYTGHVTVSASGVQGSPQVVTVTLTVTAAAPPPTKVLFGDQAVEPSIDSNVAGIAEAFQTTGAISGTISSLSVYLDASSDATKVVVGLYADSGGHPGALMTQGSTTAPKAGGWNTVTVPNAFVSAGTPYWVAILGTQSGTPRFRDRAGGSCRAETSGQGGLTALPATWSTGSGYGDCPLSGYGSGS